MLDGQTFFNVYQVVQLGVDDVWVVVLFFGVIVVFDALNNIIVVFKSFRDGIVGIVVFFLVFVVFVR